MEPVQIRLIEPSDNAELASLIRQTMAEFAVNKPGTVFFDKTTDQLFEVFQKPGSIYYVAQDQGLILGGAGISHSEGLPEKTCELVKMYLLPGARGKGLGGILLKRCLQFAENFGYRQVYIETMAELVQAIGMYRKFGFRSLDGSLGSTGHFGCDVWMIKNIRKKRDSPSLQ
jgi:putative acetyltransferase